MKTNEYKEELCKKYQPYLELIDKLGNKIMFQQQLIDLAIELNIATDKYIVIKAINQLVYGEILKKTRFGSKKTVILMFKKYAIRFLRGLSSSQAVSAVTKVNTNSRYWKSYFKVQILLEKFIPAMKKFKIDLNLVNLLKYLKDKNSTLLLNKNNTIEFYYNLINQEKFINFLNKDFVNEQIKTLQKEHDNMLNNLSNNRKEEEIDNKKKKRKRKDKWDFLYFSTIATLVRRNVYITSIKKEEYEKKTEEKIKIGGIFFDIDNKQDFKKAVTNLAITYNLLSKLFDNKKIYLIFIMYTQNEIARSNVNRNFYKKEDLLRKLKVSELDWDNFDIKIRTLKKSLVEIEIEDPVQSNQEIQEEKEKPIVAENEICEDEEVKQVHKKAHKVQQKPIEIQAVHEVQKQAIVNKEKHFISIDSLDFSDDF